MDDQRVGRALRALRQRLEWRQVDVARAAGLTQDDVSRAERGHMRDTAKLREHAAAVDAEIYVSVRWRGGELDRLLDEGHASIVAWIVTTLLSLGWDVHPEVSYAVRGERGFIDVLAWHSQTRTLLVVEVKTELISIEETLRKHDANQRLAAFIVDQRFGWGQPASVRRMLVLPESSTSRRRAERHAGVLNATYRLRGSAARAWLAKPDRTPSLLLFAPLTRETRHRNGSVRPRRIRARPPSVNRSG